MILSAAVKSIITCFAIYSQLPLKSDLYSTVKQISQDYFSARKVFKKYIPAHYFCWSEGTK